MYVCLYFISCFYWTGPHIIISSLVYQKSGVGKVLHRKLSSTISGLWTRTTDNVTCSILSIIWILSYRLERKMKNKRQTNFQLYHFRLGNRLHPSMASDEIVWQILGHQFCSFKLKFAASASTSFKPQTLTWTLTELTRRKHFAEMNIMVCRKSTEFNIAIAMATKTHILSYRPLQ